MNLLENLWDVDSKKLAVIYENKKFSYGELLEDIKSCMFFLKGKGIKKGDRIVVISELDYTILINILSVISLGAIFTPVFSSIGRSSFLYRIEVLEPKLIIMNMKKNEIRFKCATEIIDQFEFRHYNRESSDEIQFENMAETDPFGIFFTSGTTGMPKGVVHAHKNKQAIISTYKEVFSSTESDVYWCTADFAWITGSVYNLLAPLLTEIPFLLKAPSLSLNTFVEDINSNHVTCMYTSPSLIRNYMKQKCNVDITTKMRFGATVGEKLTLDAINWWSDLFNVRLTDTWFQTETGSIMLFNRSSDVNKIGSTGISREGINIRLSQENKEQYQMLIESNWDSMFIGYYKNSEIYNSKFKEGYYQTGDSFIKDNEGYYWFQSRIDDVINTAGHLVNPIEIETIVNQLSFVKESVAYGVEDKQFGERVNLLISIFEDEINEMDINLIKKTIKEELSGYAVPSRIQVVNSVLKTDTGKIKRDKKSISELRGDL